MAFVGSWKRPSQKNDPYADCTERLVQEHLAQHLDVLGPSLSLVGLEVTVAGVGRIDILARSKDELVVVEVKRDEVRREAVGQLQSYMGHLMGLDPSTKVRGVLVAAGIDAAASAALRIATAVSFLDYRSWYVRPDPSSQGLPNGWKTQVPLSWLGRRVSVEEARQILGEERFLALGMQPSDRLREFREKAPMGGCSGIALVRADRVFACAITDYGIM